MLRDIVWREIWRWDGEFDEFTSFCYSLRKDWAAFSRICDSGLTWYSAAELLLPGMFYIVLRHWRGENSTDGWKCSHFSRVTTFFIVTLRRFSIAIIETWKSRLLKCSIEVLSLESMIEAPNLTQHLNAPRKRKKERKKHQAKPNVVCLEIFRW